MKDFLIFLAALTFLGFACDLAASFSRVNTPRS
jgi:hypothetical protein